MRQFIILAVALGLGHAIASSAQAAEITPLVVTKSTQATVLLGGLSTTTAITSTAAALIGTLISATSSSSSGT